MQGAHAFNPTTCKVEAGGPQDGGQSERLSEFQTSLGHRVKPSWFLPCSAF